MTCSDCRFFEVVQQECRRHPPVLVREGSNEEGVALSSRWPRVYLDDWCGEFAARPARGPSDTNALTPPPEGRLT